MRLLKSRAAAEEALTALLNRGYGVQRANDEEYSVKAAQGTFDNNADVDVFRNRINVWGDEVLAELSATFPSELERNIFLRQGSRPSVSYVGISQKAGELRARLSELLESLEAILVTHISRYTDLPIESRLHVEDIDSFRRVRDVNPTEVGHLLSTNGYLDISEDVVQLALEQILNVSMHKKDWGGEINDLYTANVIVNGARVATAFLLKGNGLRKNVMEIADCGKNGDQLVRLVESPALLFIVQFVGNVSENIIRDIASKVRELRGRGQAAHYCIMNGQDTARALLAYGKLASAHTDGEDAPAV